MATVDTKTLDIDPKISQGFVILIPEKGLDKLTYDPIDDQKRN